MNRAASGDAEQWSHKAGRISGADLLELVVQSCRNWWCGVAGMGLQDEQLLDPWELSTSQFLTRPAGTCLWPHGELSDSCSATDAHDESMPLGIECSPRAQVSTELTM